MEIAQTIWLARPDLRGFCNGDRDVFTCWLALCGEAEYRALAEHPIIIADHLLEGPATGIPALLDPPLTRFMQLVWSMRDDLQSQFDLTTREGQTEYSWWFFLPGAAEYKLARYFTETQRAYLNQPVTPEGVDDAGDLVPFTRLMLEIWRRRPDLQQVFNLSTAPGRSGFKTWYYLHGLGEMKLLGLLDSAQLALLRGSETGSDGVPRILMMMWGRDAGLQQAFPTPDAARLRRWAAENALDDYPILGILFPDMSIGDTTDVTMAAPAVVTAPAPALRPGVNLIGYPRGQFGIGEDVRMAARALRAASVPYTIYNARLGAGVDQDEHSADADIGADLPFAVNLFCMPANETAQYHATEGAACFEGRFSIGYWPWELPEWPAAWDHAYGLVQEVWASSRYTYAAFADRSPVRVRHMPMAVAVDATDGLSRRDFQLPQDTFLFVFSFDGLSSFTRKNPIACIQAFKAAFPLGSEPAGLVIKAMRADANNGEWQRLQAEAAGDRRIHLIAGTMGRGAVLDLYRACDCYVSLHRAEGFGRGMAEAMLMGKPVIATGYSGNLDFTVPGAAALVDYRLRAVGQGEYPLGEGQRWAEPDIDHAAWWMQRVFADIWLRHRLSQQGRQLASSAFSPQIVGEEYKYTLRRIGYDI